MNAFRRVLLAACACVMVMCASPLALAQHKPAEPPHDAKAHAKAAAKPAEPNAKADAKKDKAEPEPIVGWIEISDHLHEGVSAPGLGGKGAASHSLRGLLTKLKHVATEPRCKGVVLFIDEPELELAQVNEITLAVAQVRAAGKKVIAFSQGYDLKSYLLACSADRVVLQHKGVLEVQGLGIEEMYMAGLFEKIGLKADFLQVGQFKGAEEPLTRMGPSDAWNSNINALLDDLYDQVITRVAEARKISKADIEKAFVDSWGLTDEQYVQRGLIDELSTRDMVELTEKLFGEDFSWDQDLGELPGPKFDNPFALLQMLMQAPQKQASRPSIALVHANGEIFSGESGSGGVFSDEGIGSKTLVRALGEARDDDMIKGVVLRIDSPGGSATASEAIWQAVSELADTKPVYISIGAMAASGGYYIASAGQTIYVDPASIVGSIGVVGGKFIVGDLYQKLGVGVTRRSRGPLGDMFNSVEPFTEAQRVTLRAAFAKTYDLFVERVKEGRGDHIADIEKVAQGRLFTGKQAVTNGMADKLGGVQLALTDMASECELKPGEYDVIDLPEPRTFPEILEDFMSGFAHSPSTIAPDAAATIAAARTLMGPVAWRSARSVVAGMMLMRREPTLLLLPAVIRIK
jgi:protease IV